MWTNIKIKHENDHIFKNGDFHGMVSETVFSVSEIPEIKREKYFFVAENTVEATTIQAIINRAGHGNITALNFANAMYAGGAYVLGGNAQEESLCRASMLYYAIRTQKEYYRRNRIHILPDYTDTLIYSQNVPIIRDDSGKLLNEKIMCDFITVPAVNRTFARFMFSDKNISEKMYRRIEKIIILAMLKKPNIIILGAFGCGMFGNRRETVFPIFEEIINKYVPDSVEVIFAIP